MGEVEFSFFYHNKYNFIDIDHNLNIIQYHFCGVNLIQCVELISFRNDTTGHQYNILEITQ